MKRTCAQKSSICRHTHDSTKKPLLNKTNRLTRKSSTISIKKTIKENNYYRHQHYPYMAKKKRFSLCSANNDNDLNNKNDASTLSHSHRPQEDLTEIDPTYLSTLRHEAYDELHRQMQQYNDSFVMKMKQAEQQRHEVTDQRPAVHHRRRSFQKQPYHRRRSSLVSSTSSSKQHNIHSHHHRHSTHHLHYYPQEDNDPGIEELVDMLKTGTIKDYSLLTEWELCQDPQIELEEEQIGGFGDLW